MIARTVLVFLVWMTLFPLWGQSIIVKLRPGWNPRFVARKYSSSQENFSKFTYRNPKSGQALHLIDPKTGKVTSLQFHLPAGTIIEIPENLVVTESFNPEGKTLKQVCSDHSEWNCRQLRANNRIRNINRSLRTSIQVPKTRISLAPPNAPKFDPKLRYEDILQPVFWNTDSVSWTATAFVALLIGGSILLLFKGKDDSSVRFEFLGLASIRDFLRFPARRRLFLRRSRKVWYLLIPQHLGTAALFKPPIIETLDHRRQSLALFAETFIVEFKYGHIPNPDEDDVMSGHYYVFKRRGTVHIYLVASPGRRFPNMREQRQNVLQKESYISQLGFAQSFVPVRRPREIFSFRRGRQGVKFVYRKVKEEEKA